MANLKSDLPDDLLWLSEKVEGLVRPSFFLKRSKDHAPFGATRAWGRPDIPADAAWALREGTDGKPRSWDDSPYDDESFVMQVNLGEIPESVRRPCLPKEGVVWVFADLTGDWKAVVRFDKRPAASIPWAKRSGKEPCGCEWVPFDTMPFSTEKNLSEIAYVPSMRRQFDDWAEANYWDKRPSDLQVGGWTCPCQGDFDERNLDFVAGLDGLEFGDSGSVHLHFDKERGFYAFVETH